MNPYKPPRARVVRRGAAAALLLALAARPGAAEPNVAREEFRVGFSASTFWDVNLNDALAAVKVWAGVISRDHGIPIDPEPRVLPGVAAIDRLLRDGMVDAVSLNSLEFHALRDRLDPRVFITNVCAGRIGEEYVLLTHRESGIVRLEDLRGRAVAFCQSPRTILAPVWLDTVLLAAGLPRVATYCQVVPVPKVSKAVLPVFFRQIDACVVTRSSFMVMRELNPQLGQRLQVVTSSPELVPSAFFFRRDYTSPLRELMIRSFEEMLSSPSGAQILALFQSDSLQALPVSRLDPTLDLIVRHERMCTAAAATSGSPADGARSVPP
jgi:phosphonate transport system substrate-binding protein